MVEKIEKLRRIPDATGTSEIVLRGDETFLVLHIERALAGGLGERVEILREIVKRYPKKPRKRTERLNALAIVRRGRPRTKALEALRRPGRKAGYDAAWLRATLSQAERARKGETEYAPRYRVWLKDSSRRDTL